MTEDDAGQASNDGQVFDRLPETEADRVVAGRATRHEVLDWWAGRFALPAETFAGHTFWEKGAGKIWAFAGDVPDSATVEALGLVCLRTRREHWKPTTVAVRRFGRRAGRNVIALDRASATRFIRGEDQPVETDCEQGYVVVAHDLAGDRAPIGVGLLIGGELRSQIPKAHRRDV